MMLRSYTFQQRGGNLLHWIHLDTCQRTQIWDKDWLWSKISTEAHRVRQLMLLKTAEWIALYKNIYISPIIKIVMSLYQIKN